MKRRYYTLIELLTVIAIIAILAGLIFPALSIARLKAKRLECASNIRQVGAMMLQFSSDRDGQLPLYLVTLKETSKQYHLPSTIKEIANCQRERKKFKKPLRTSSTAPDRRLWTAGLARYAKYDMKLFFCPSDERELDIFNEEKLSSYSYNYGSEQNGGVKEPMAPGGKKDGSTFVNMGQVTRSPAGVVLLGETGTGKLGMDSNQTNGGAFIEKYYTGKGKEHKPHGKDFNYVFLDGHTESLRTGAIRDMFDREYFRITPKPKPAAP